MGAIKALKRVLGLLSGLLASGGGHAVTLPEDHAEAMFHLYDGGGVTASGPALLVRKSLADRVSLSASYYVDMVSNASIDVVTTASPFKEKRTAYDLGLDYVVRDAQITVSTTNSTEPDYTAKGMGVDVSQEVFGGMTTVTLGYAREWDDVRKHNQPDFADAAKHWHYRFGATQILSPRWLVSANAEMIADDGYLGSPYRVARVFGGTVPERNPRTRTGRALQLRSTNALDGGSAAHAAYRYYWDNWAIKAHTLELGYSRHVGEAWLADGFARYYTQTHALFYSDDAAGNPTYVSRNRQLSTFHDISIGAKLSRTVARVAGKYELKLNGSFELMRFKFDDFTDVRTHQLYGFDARVIQFFLSGTF